MGILIAARRAAALYVLALIVTVAPSLPARSAEPSDYEKLVARAKAGDQDVDFGKLREAYIDSPGYDPYSTSALKQSVAMNQALNQDDCNAALIEAEHIIETNFVNIEAHFIAPHCYDVVGRSADAQRERGIGQGLVSSILKSGDGKTPETAFVVVTVAEEYLVLAALKLRRSGQALIGQDKHDYDRLDAKPVSDPSKTVSVFFRIDPILAKADKQLQKFKKPESNEAARP